ncbi:hypothetical protein GCM10007063_30210 [Lentibacillus kapialis]|uniref:LicD/FKTN/FKRP nucleotidyltransferase domain-containing protein n=2 Tax=Lentibacillus kapialis TaxID=340214 RepID=A0A917Q1G0_9BACI|nr:hypothetical protein GCM10007063_30210 [Lentibacillus kapialis]
MEYFLKDLFYKLGVYRIAKHYLQKPYLNLVGFFFQFSANVAIRKFIQAMQDNNYTYWLEFGTLLGAIREQGMLSHDTDIDVAMHAEDWHPGLEHILRHDGFKLKKRARLLTGEVIEETYTYKTARVDIFYAYRKGEHLILYDHETTGNMSPNECIRRFGGLKVYENKVQHFDIAPYPFCDYQACVPGNYYQHLELLYGPHFMIPDKNWSLTSRTVRKETEYLARIE